MVTLPVFFCREQKKKVEKQTVSGSAKHHEVVTVTVGDLERAWEKELNDFQTASRITGKVTSGTDKVGISW